MLSHGPLFALRVCRAPEDRILQEWFRESGVASLRVFRAHCRARQGIRRKEVDAMGFLRHPWRNDDGAVLGLLQGKSLVIICWKKEPRWFFLFFFFFSFLFFFFLFPFFFLFVPFLFVSDRILSLTIIWPPVVSSHSGPGVGLISGRQRQALGTMALCS